LPASFLSVERIHALPCQNRVIGDDRSLCQRT
jgi:hypothetical protein